MLTVVVGNDTNLRLKSVDSLLGNTPSEEILVLFGLQTTSETLYTNVYNDGLFGQIGKIYIQSAKENEELWNYILSNAEKFHEAEMHIILSEVELTVSDIRILEKVGNEIIKTVGVSNKMTSGDSFKSSPFILSDYIFLKDKKNAWITYHKLQSEGVSAIELENVIIWSLKNLLLVSQASRLPKSEQRLSLKPFVFSKIERGLSFWNREEIITAYENVIELVSTHRFKEDYDVHMERVLLEILS